MEKKLLLLRSELYFLHIQNEEIMFCCMSWLCPGIDMILTLCTSYLYNAPYYVTLVMMVYLKAKGLSAMSSCC
uniref:Uncharacterized protein n=1 Tax=Arundo donax TaxID=35708 RepID=A0A0A9CUL5_ARUDO